MTTGAILRLGADGKATPVVQGIKGPADFALSADGRRLLIPDLKAGTVTLHDLP